MQLRLNYPYEGDWSGPLEPAVSDLSITEAYAVQDLVAEMRIQRGEEVVGFKVGCTSEAIRSQFGLNEPISARLFRPHIYEEGAEVNWSNYVNCAIEPEMVLTIGVDLCETGLPDDQLIDAIECVNVGIELHNFRFWFRVLADVLSARRLTRFLRQNLPPLLLRAVVAGRRDRPPAG